MKRFFGLFLRRKKTIYFSTLVSILQLIGTPHFAQGEPTYIDTKDLENAPYHLSPADAKKMAEENRYYAKLFYHYTPEQRSAIAKTLCDSQEKPSLGPFLNCNTAEQPELKTPIKKNSTDKANEIRIDDTRHSLTPKNITHLLDELYLQIYNEFYCPSTQEDHRFCKDNGKLENQHLKINEHQKFLEDEYLNGLTRITNDKNYLSKHHERLSQQLLAHQESECSASPEPVSKCIQNLAKNLNEIKKSAGTAKTLTHGRRSTPPVGKENETPGILQRIPEFTVADESPSTPAEGSGHDLRLDDLSAPTQPREKSGKIVCDGNVCRLVPSEPPPPRTDSNQPPLEKSPKKPTSRGLITAEVNLGKHPTDIRRPPWGRGDEITLGDLHGNSMKFIYFLIQEGVLKLSENPKTSQELYEELNQIYKQGGLENDKPDEKGIKRFNEILAKSKITPNGPKVRLLGDELGDRGNNDYFTLKLFEKLHQGTAPFEVILSNHSLEFMRYYEQELTSGNTTQWKSDLGTGLAKSTENFQKLMANDSGKKKEMIALIQSAYLPYVKLVSHSINQEKKLSLYSHAPIGLGQISNYVQKYCDPRWSKTCEETELKKGGGTLQDCIQLVNKHFTEQRNNKSISSLIEQENGEGRLEPMNFFLWNRDLNDLNRISKFEDNTQIHYVHGHESSEEHLPNTTKGNVTNLDNHLGKGGNKKDGTYSIYHTLNNEDLTP